MKKYVIILTQVLIWSAEVKASNLEELLAQYLQQSPVFQEAQKHVEFSSEDRWRRFVPADPTLVYERDQAEMTTGLGLELEFQFPGKAFAYQEFDDLTHKKSKIELQTKKLGIARNFIESYLECAGAIEEYKVREKAFKELEKQLKEMQGRHRIMPSEKLSFELEVRQSLQELKDVKVQKESRCFSFEGLAPETKEKISYKLPDRLSNDFFKKMELQDTSEKKLEIDNGLFSQRSKLASWDQMPEISLSYMQKKYDSSAESFAGESQSVFGVSLKIPIFFPMNGAKEIQRNRSQIIVEKYESWLEHQQTNSLRFESMQSFKHQTLLLKEIRQTDMPLSRRLIDLSRKAFQSGQIGYAEIAHARNVLLNLQLKEITLKKEIIKSQLHCLNYCPEI